MQQIHTVAVIGGTGKSGKYLVSHLSNQGLHLKILVRNPQKINIQNSLAQIIIGDVRNYADVKSLMTGCQAVISTLGLGLPPSEPTIFSMSTSHIIRAMHECEVRRYIVTTGLNVDTPLDKKSEKVKAATAWMYANYPKSTTDKQEEYRILSESNIDWTMVRLPLIEQTEERRKVSISLEDCPSDKISATDLAYFLAEQLADNMYIRKAPFISND
ncbi:NAD(P)H-binding protein [Rhodocytophaga rosea]|uniref:NAD(P)H-binding protein n=1 Tax=Rhodocytophaga rosea TaxID=2704465 RepID=A0A6C0GFA6_9BACT|nr:NAD(P)H-binding protein [Rhodocytophaga rosea]QHT66443.1 NAD(P)H-binding protein [Rhodocytophaga rosea]